MIDVNLTVSDIKKVIDLLPNDENKFELEQLLIQLESEIEIQQQFVEGATNYLLKTKQLEKAKTHALDYTNEKLYNKAKQEQQIIESRGMKAPYYYTDAFELDFYIDDVKHKLEV